jgi:hypothetical protein
MRLKPFSGSLVTFATRENCVAIVISESNVALATLTLLPNGMICTFELQESCTMMLHWNGTINTLVQYEPYGGKLAWIPLSCVCSGRRKETKMQLWDKIPVPGELLLMETASGAYRFDVFIDGTRECATVLCIGTVHSWSLGGYRLVSWLPDGRETHL